MTKVSEKVLEFDETFAAQESGSVLDPLDLAHMLVLLGLARWELVSIHLVVHRLENL